MMRVMGTGTRLQAVASRGRSGAAERYLLWEPQSARISYHTTDPGETEWSVRLGTGVWELARCVRVRGALPYAVSRLLQPTAFQVDHYAFLSSTGQVLVPGVPAGSDTSSAARFPPQELREFANQADLAYDDDRVATWSDLTTRYPDLIPSAPTLARRASLWAAVGITVGVLTVLVGVAALWAGTHGVPLGYFLGTVVAVAGVTRIWYALELLEPIARHRAQRRTARAGRRRLASRHGRH